MEVVNVFLEKNSFEKVAVIAENSFEKVLRIAKKSFEKVAVYLESRLKKTHGGNEMLDGWWQN